MKSLNESGVLTQQGFTWHRSAITRILKNYTYTGNLILQTKFRENHLTKRTLINNGELPQYHATNTHEPIIDIGTYNSVQLEMKRRAEKFSKKPTHNTYPFTGLITCDNCGKHYRRKVTPTGSVWICSTYNTYGKSKCPSKAIPETTLTALADEIGGIDKITAITAMNNNTLEFTLASGETITKHWKDRSRAESWTKEMRDVVGKKNKDRRMQNANS